MKQKNKTARKFSKHGAPIDSINIWIFSGFGPMLILGLMLTMMDSGSRVVLIIGLVLSFIGSIGALIPIKRILIKKNHHLIYGDEFTSEIIKTVDAFSHRLVIAAISVFIILYFLIAQIILDLDFFKTASVMTIVIVVLGIISLGNFASVGLCVYRIKKGMIIDEENMEEEEALIDEEQNQGAKSGE